MTNSSVRIVGTIGCFVFIIASLAASEDGPGRPSSTVFLAARMTDARLVDVRASEATSLEIINAVREAFGGTMGSISVVPTIHQAFFKGADVESQMMLRVKSRTMFLQPSSGLDFGIVRAAASRLANVEGIGQVYIVGFGRYSPPSDASVIDPFDVDTNYDDPFRKPK